MPMIFGLSDSTALKTGIILSEIQTYIQKCNLKLYHARKMPYMYKIQKHCCLLWAKAKPNFTMLCDKVENCWSDNANLAFFLETMWTVSLMAWLCITMETSGKAVKTSFSGKVLHISAGQYTEHICINDNSMAL